MALTPTLYDAALKRRFTTKKIESLMFSDRPLLAMVPKDTSYSGSALQVPLIHAAPQGLGALSLATAQASATNIKAKAFLMTIGDYFAKVDISGKVLLESRDNAGAFLSSKTAEIDALYEQVADVIHIQMWGNGGGAIGKRASLSTNTVTLSEPSTVFAFEEGMTVVASAADGSGGSDALRTGSTTVASVDRVNGTVTLTSAAAITSFADNDYLFRAGDFGGNSGANMIQGVQAYIYSTDTSVPNLWGMVRSSDPTRLAGCRVAAGDLTGRNSEERIKLLGARMAGRYKAKLPTAGFMNPEDWQNLEIALNARGVRDIDDPATAQFGFTKLICTMGGARVPIYPDRACPKGTFFGLRMENWTLWSMLDLVHVMNGDGMTMLRLSNANDFEYRLESFPQLITNAPLFNGRVPV